MTSGIEWNYRFSSLADGRNFNLFYETFLDLFERHSIVIDDKELAFYSQNWHKPAAAGIGKTYLTAFDSVSHKRVLFVAHREEILQQAAVSFQNVRQSEDYGFFNGKQKDTNKAVIFASVATLGREAGW